MIIYTIGYEGLDQRQFIAHLSHHGINVVADVRKVPISHKKGFSKTSLKELLNNSGIDYLNFRELGTPKEIREELSKTGNYKRFVKEYQKSLSGKKELLDAIHQFLDLGKKVALLCFERNPQECHRSILAEEIKKFNNNNLVIQHIVPL